MDLRRDAPAPVRAQRTRDPGADARGCAEPSAEEWAQIVACLREAADTIAASRKKADELQMLARAIHERARLALDEARHNLQRAKAGMQAAGHTPPRHRLHVIGGHEPHDSSV